MPDRKFLTLPNGLCLLRFALAPVLMFLAWEDARTPFILIMVLAFLLDAVDGPIARWFHLESELGPRLDTVADVAVYLSLPVGIWWLWPALIRQEWLYFLLIVMSVLVPSLTGIIKFRDPTSYHTWLVKAAAVVTAMATFVLLLGGPVQPFRAASFLCLAAGLEEVIITLVLDKPRSNVRTLVHVLRDRK